MVYNYLVYGLRREGVYRYCDVRDKKLFWIEYVKLIF